MMGRVMAGTRTRADSGEESLGAAALRLFHGGDSLCAACGAAANREACHRFRLLDSLCGDVPRISSLEQAFEDNGESLGGFAQRVADAPAINQVVNTPDIAAGANSLHAAAQGQAAARADAGRAVTGVRPSPASSRLARSALARSSCR